MPSSVRLETKTAKLVLLLDGDAREGDEAARGGTAHRDQRRRGASTGPSRWATSWSSRSVSERFYLSNWELKVRPIFFRNAVLSSKKTYFLWPMSHLSEPKIFIGPRQLSGLLVPAPPQGAQRRAVRPEVLPHQRSVHTSV